MHSIAVCGPTIYRTAILEHIRSAHADIRIAGQSGTADDAPSLISHVVPDVVLMISGASAASAAQIIGRVRKVDLDVRIVWWALVPTGVDYSELIESDVSVVYWETSAEDIIAAMQLPAASLMRTISRPRLTHTEHTVLQLAANGLSNRAIAYRLSISESTVKNHLRHIAAKFNTSSRAQSVWQAVQWGYLSAQEKHEVS